MRLVIDLQALQTSGSQTRGIGRYSLALVQSMVRHAGAHEIVLALNSCFPDSIEYIRTAFDGSLDQSNIRVWQGLPFQGPRANAKWRERAAEKIREAFLTSLKPDMVLVSSLFEGLGDDAVTSVGALSMSIPTAVTLYDLIPLIYRDRYLQNPVTERWYEEKLAHLRRADLLLAISESTRREAIDHLGFPEDRVHNISGSVDAQFRPVTISDAARAELCERFGLRRPFVMYTGGIDYRKNIESLIRAYALLPRRFRTRYQLAIICSIKTSDRERLGALARRHGLDADEVVFTGFISDADLVALYNLCEVFCFPSLHEGFGLPVLEAMACGAAVIAANASSLPEIVGRDDAMFPANDDRAIASILQKALSEQGFRESLRRHGLQRSRLFSWDISGQRALATLDERCAHLRRVARPVSHARRGKRPRLVYVSPLPPLHTGIADYSAELLTELANYYDVNVVVAQKTIECVRVSAACAVRTTDWFGANVARNDRIVYHFGNSEVHSHMFELLQRRPGAVVLHDFFLSGVIRHREQQESKSNTWTRALYNSHGYPGVAKRFLAPSDIEAVWKYPANLEVLQLATGVIVHSDISRKLAQQWFGKELPSSWRTIPLMRTPAPQVDRAEIRQELGFDAGDFVVCSFGMLGAPKNNHRLLAAWLRSRLATDPACHLVFVGESREGEYERALDEAIRSSGKGGRIRITGFVSPETYRRWLAAADTAVQLRSNTRGETSAAVLDCLNYSVPTVVNAHGFLATLPPASVLMLPEAFVDDDLVRALELLRQDADARRTIAEEGRKVIREGHSPTTIAAQYFEAIESFHEEARHGRVGLMDAIVGTDEAPTSERDWLEAAQSISQSLPLPTPVRQLFIDVSGLIEDDAKTRRKAAIRNILKHLLENSPIAYRIEPVYATKREPYRYARRFTLRLLECPETILDDEPIESHPGDVFLGLDSDLAVARTHESVLVDMRNRGVEFYFVVHQPASSWLDILARADGAICPSPAIADEIHRHLTENLPPRRRPFNIGLFDLGACSSEEVEKAADGAPARTWAESAAQLEAVVLGRSWYTTCRCGEPPKHAIAE